ncbi:MAG: FAD-dependent oxidoreductase [Alphaproteobacteria bacterium]|nr:FAD-dependent oxidoreductase [Alphaproteobacteria bacterium]
MTDALLDVLIVGGGPAGLTAALVTGRARLRTLVVDAGDPRSAVVDHTHGLFTRDGASPQHLREEGRRQLERYPTVRVVTDRVRTLRREDGVFIGLTEDGLPLHARRVILATGFRDDLTRAGLPDIAAVYGRSVFPCPFCDGFELSDRRVAVFAPRPSPHLGHYLSMISVLSTPDFTLFTHGRPVDPALREALARRGLGCVEEPITALASTDGRLTGVRTADGRLHPRDAGFILNDFATQATDLAARLGVPDVPGPFGAQVPEVDEQGRTPVEGLYVAGDARASFAGLVRASAQGALCGAVIVGEVAEERWRE